MGFKVGHFTSKKYFIKNSYNKMFGSHSVEYHISGFLKRREWNKIPSRLSGGG